MNGFFLVNKEKNYTSNDVVQKIKKKFSFKQVGHLGTLDPIAEGLIILAVNRATKFSNYFLESDKSYFVEIKLGISTDTHDLTGQIVAKAPVKVTEKALKNEINNFLGASFQKPPYFSALKHKGRPLYEYARKGEFINKEPRQIEIKEIKNITYKNEICSFELTCSKGTYIRTLGVDIAKKIECNCIMKDLERTSIGPWNLDDSVKFPIIKNLDNREKMQYVKRIEEILKDFPKVKIRSSEVKKFQNGSSIDAEINEKFKKHSVFFEEDFLGIGEFVEGRGLVPRTLYKV